MEHVFLVPPGPDTEGVSDALVEARSDLASLAPDVIVVASSAWRPFHFAVSPFESELAAAIAEAARQADLFVEIVAHDLDPGAVAVLGTLFPKTSPPVVAVGVARQSPERTGLFGEAVAQALGAHSRQAALVGVGLLGRTSSPDAGRRFDEGVLASLEARQGDRLLTSDPLVWIEGKPDAELGHLFLLLGAAGPGASGHTLGYVRSGDAGRAVVRFEPGTSGDRLDGSPPHIITLKDVGHD